MSMSWVLCFLFAAVGMAAVCQAAGGKPSDDRPGLTAIETSVIDADATGYATFQSHNQKVASSPHGIFAAWIRTRNQDYTAQQWRLARSTDGGRTFSVLHEAVAPTNPPVIEVDADSVYLGMPDFVTGKALVRRLDAADGFRMWPPGELDGAGAGKYSMLLDEKRECLYFFSHYGWFHVLDLGCNVQRQVRLTAEGPNAQVMYPLLALDQDGTLHAAWTTQKHGVYLYRSIRHAVSFDGGVNWQTLAGDTLYLPITCDDTGPAEAVTRDDELDVHTWLSSMIARDGKLHMAYLAQTDPQRQHYVRFDVATGERDVDTWPEWKGDRISLHGLDGFFAARASLPGGTLYYVSRAGNRIACLASDDSGATWYDYAVSDEFGAIYSIGGAREITADGHVIGTFTDSSSYEGPPKDPTESPAGGSHVVFIKFRAGLSSAKVVRADYADGELTAEFTDVRGQPAQVRFRAGAGEWTAWQPFAPELKTKLPARPTHYQLKSRMGVGAPAGTLP